MALSFYDNEQPSSLATLPEIFGGSITNNFRSGMRDFAFINRNFNSQAGNQGFTFAQQTGVGTFNNLMMIDGDSGKIGIGNTAPGKLLHVGSATVGTGLAVANFQNADGTCTITPAAAGPGIACSSDERLKENFQDVQGVDVLDRILKLQAVTYNFKTASTETRRTGYKAQEVQKVAPEFVRQDDNGFFQVYYDGLIPWITEAIKTLYNRIMGVEAHQGIQDRAIASVSAKAAKLESENIQLKKDNAQVKQENAAIKAYLCGKDRGADICN